MILFKKMAEPFKSDNAVTGECIENRKILTKDEQGVEGGSMRCLLNKKLEQRRRMSDDRQGQISLPKRKNVNQCLV